MANTQTIYGILISFACLLACNSETMKNPVMATYTGPIADSAMVVTAHPLATKVGVQILQQGGNAIDASVAVQMALAVVYPIAGNIGGGGFMVYRQHNGNTTCLDFREKAPSKAHRDMYLDEKGEVIPRLSLDGHLAAGVPGTVDACVKAHQKYGKLPFAKLVEPAIKLAQEGFVCSQQQIKYLNEKQADFKRLNKHVPVLYKTEGWQHGDTLVQPELANTLRLIRDKGRAGFYEGITADNIVAEMKKGNGIISHEDLKNYASIWRTPVTGKYKDYRIISMPPPSSGGIALVQLCTMLEKYDLQKMGHNSAATIHHMVEAERRVYADRATHLGDADFYKVPVTGLLDAKYLFNRMHDFEPDKSTASTSISAGTPVGAIATKSNEQVESEETTHFSIVDQFGNAVSVTTTLNAAYGSKTMVEGSGFLLNNEMDDFSAKPGVPNLYGLVGNEANAIAPHKRMLSSMTPTIIEKSGNLFMVLGSPGGSTIITSVLQNFLNVVEHGMSMQESVNANRFHHQWQPDTLYVERNVFAPKTLNALKNMGHNVAPRSTIGRVDAILVRPDKTLEGGADIRGDDTALGF